jgi:hypothetical protein
MSPSRASIAREMGAKTAILADPDRDPREVLRGRPALDRAAALDLVGRVFPDPDDPLPFGPMALGEEALRAFFGFVYDGEPRPGDLDPSEVALVGVRLGWPPRPRRLRPA